MILTAAETPERIRISFGEEDAKYLAARVNSGRLAISTQMHLGEASTLLALATGEVPSAPSGRRADKIAAAGAAVREGEAGTETGTFSVEWDVPTIRNVRTHMLYASLEENARTGRRMVDTPTDTPAERLYEELHEAERRLCAEYEQTQGEPYPMPAIDVVIGPKTY